MGVRVLIYLLIVVSNPERAHANDSRSYNDCALVLAEQGRFYKELSEDSPPEVFRTPGYPLFLASFYKVFGFKYPPVIFLQMFLGGLLIPLLLYLVLKDLTTENIACVGVLLAGLDPNTLILEMSILSETLAHVSVALICYACYRLFVKQYFWSSIILISAFLIISTFIRPITYYLTVCLAVGIVSCLKVYQFNRFQLMGVIAFVLVIPLTAFRAWEIRNHKRTGMDLISSVSAVNMLHYRAAAVYALKNDITFEEARSKMDLFMDLDGTISSANINERRMEFGKKIIKENLFVYSQVALNSIPKLLIGPGVTQVMMFLGEHDRWQIVVDSNIFEAVKEWYSRSPVVILVLSYAFIYIALINILAVLGFIRILIVDQRFFIFHLSLIGMFAYFILISSGPEAYARFRAPFSVIYYYLATQGVLQFIYYCKKIS